MTMDKGYQDAPRTPVRDRGRQRLDALVLRVLCGSMLIFIWVALLALLCG